MPNLIDLNVVASFTISLIGVFVVTYFLVIKKTPKAHILKKIGDTYEHVATKNFKLSATTIKYKNKIYDLDLTKAIRWRKSKPHIFFDIEKLSPLTFFENKIYNAEMFQTLTDNTLLKKLFGKDAEKLLIIVVLVLGVALIISVAFNLYVVSNPQQFIHTATNTTSVIIKGNSPIV